VFLTEYICKYIHIIHCDTDIYFTDSIKHIEYQIDPNDNQLLNWQSVARCHIYTLHRLTKTILAQDSSEVSVRVSKLRFLQ